jgi:hypothetical protein
MGAAGKDGGHAGSGGGRIGGSSKEAGREAGKGKGNGAAQRVADAVFELVGKVPHSVEKPHADPLKRARSIGNRTAAKAALSAGSLSLPPGPLGWLTILPELRTVWKQQAQMVADIAAAFGKSDLLTREEILYCLFRHIAPGAFRDVISRAEDGYVVRPASPAALRAVVQKIGLRVTLRVLGRGVSRWVPVVGALGVGAYAYYDTGQVAGTAMSLFSKDIDIDPPDRPST